MAILVIHEDVYKDTRKMRACKNYFDEFTRLSPKGEYPARYFVFNPGLPQDSTQVSITLSWEEDTNTFRVSAISILSNKV